jgi:glycosyltransferase involved in cell wall biosynthesis
LINQRGHKLACIATGYTAETFVTHLFYYTDDFDYVARQGFLWRCLLAWRCLFRYRVLFFYFKGGPFAWTGLLRLEPWIYKIAGIKTLVTAYGGDCHDWNHCPNLLFKHAMNCDYPHVCRKNHRARQRIDRWTLHADHILSGCDWVAYTPRWDSLCTAHFAVDVNEITPPDPSFPVNRGTITVLHAPNHAVIKGSRFFMQAVEELRQEGYDVELQYVQRISNADLKELIRKADIIADQLIVGWHGMFAVESMSAGKPVLCYLQDNLLELYEFAGVLSPGEIPLVNCTRHTVKERLRELLENRERIAEIGRMSREYVVRRHSVAAVGRLFGNIFHSMGIEPRQPGAG